MGADLGYALLIGFAGMKVTQLYKEVLRRLDLHQLSWWKSLVSVVVCLGVSLGLVPHRSVATRVLIGLAASGLAALLHALDTDLRSRRDDRVSQLMSRARQRQR